MIYDSLSVALLSLLGTESSDSTNAHIARYLLEHQQDLDELSVKSLAEACHVGTGSVSRFAKEVGFGSFADLRQAFVDARRGYARVEGSDVSERAQNLARLNARALALAATSVDKATVTRLAHDLHAHERVQVFGPLKAQSAALSLQVDLLMQGKLVESCNAWSDQLERIARATRDELVIVFSYTGTFLEARDLHDALQRLDRPKLWMVCGNDRPLPSYVSDRVLFTSDQSPFGHPYQLEFVAGLIAQEYAALDGTAR
jgi:DNA-binding MurR/RpiR family transcriptional regulator